MTLTISHISRLCISGITRHFHTEAHPLLFHSTPNLMSEPIKRKKKADAGILLARENRKIKRIEKDIRKIERFGRKLKPIEEIIGKVAVRKNKDKLKREMEPLLYEESEYRALLLKKWHYEKAGQHQREMSALSTAIIAQTKALDSLREESEELYQKALQIHERDVMYKFTGPVETPPVDDFDSPDGLYIETTKQY